MLLTDIFKAVALNFHGRNLIFVDTAIGKDYTTDKVFRDVILCVGIEYSRVRKVKGIDILQMST